jgi:hypothetical protein
MNIASILERCEAGSRLSGELLTRGEINYITAVKWCLDNALEGAGLEDDGFCQKFYGAVVAKLEEDVKFLIASN